MAEYELERLPSSSSLSQLHSKNLSKHVNGARICGIEMPYQAQVRVYRRVLQRLHESMLDKDFRDVMVGTAEYWQGKDTNSMFVDFVRDSNDSGIIAFLVNRSCANVLMTRRKVA